MKSLALTVLFVALSSAALVKNIEKGEDIPAGGNNNDPSQAAKICSLEGSEGVLVAHENCNQFYKCNFGVPVAFTCYNNLLFDPSIDRCEWPNTVDCGDRVIPEQVETNPEGNDWNGNGDGNDDPSQAPAICAAEGSDNSYVAHENCNQFYQCWAGLPVPLFCPDGLLFNPDKDYCDFPSNVKCDRGIADNIQNDNNNQDENKDDAPVGSNNNDPSQASSICRSSESEGILVAHENCNQYYICNFGAPVVQQCPSNLLFDPSKDRCEWPETVDCGDRIIPEPNENVPGNEWNGNGAGNDDPSQANAICAAEGSDNSYVAHENCNQFYQCWAGHPVALFCPVGFLFNPKVDYCDFPINVDCGNRLQ